VVINHLNFDRGRISPYLAENASVGADLYKREKYSVKLQADAQNLSNKLEVIDFVGLFSGNAIGPSRSFSCACQLNFDVSTFFEQSMPPSTLVGEPCVAGAVIAAYHDSRNTAAALVRPHICGAVASLTMAC